jgi:hypothetical protein
MLSIHLPALVDEVDQRRGFACPLIFDPELFLEGRWTCSAKHAVLAMDKTPSTTGHLGVLAVLRDLLVFSLD